MKVNDYVRTEDGTITRIKMFYEKKWEEPELIYARFLCEDYEIYEYPMQTKSSPNIIDLFEEHDLVVIEYYSLRYKERVTRLFEVDYKDKEFMTLKNAHCDFILRNNEFNDEDKKSKPIIKSILTHEQFESMEYKVKE